ncbi:hypothetical protein niasHS_012276 [Heterodera schachtii]|uniref:C-CAP/cofactor C-like domain-containing protein n=1 Tax=Heterodera schachtii TaxID=97005 RepID=A0ABD2II90_HETSC
MSGQQKADGLFPVDECFGTNIGRPIAELVDENGFGRESREELVSFEEFVRGGDKKRGKKEKDEGFGFRPIDNGGGGEDDVKFFDIALNGGGTVPEDPMSSADRMPKGRGRSELYAVKQHDDDDNDKWGRVDNRQSEWDDDAMFASAAPTTKLRHSLCPTVGEGGGWLSGGRTRRESQDSAAYGYEPPDEPCPAAKMAKTDDGPANATISSLSRCPSSRRSFKASERQKENGTNEAQGTHNGGSQMVQSNSLGDLMLSKFLCCFRALNPAHLGGAERKCGGEMAEKMGQNETDKCYSWDRRDGQRPNAADFRFANETGKTLVKEPGQLNGQSFQIERCKDSLILLMDRTASLTVDDSRDCVILAGPCQGSIFLRDCSGILILAVCQQFRTRDCRQLVAHLFCATSPTIEETDVTICPLLLNYSELLPQMHSAGLSPFVNHWSKVHNFTPETGKCHLSPHGVVLQSAAIHNFPLAERLNDFVAHSPSVDRWKLCIGNAKNSPLFVEEKDENRHTTDNEKDNNVLVLLQPMDSFNPGLRFYAESVQLAIDLRGLGRLVAMQDIDLRAGEWEVLLGQNKQQKKQKKHMTNRKMITLEFEGPEIAKNIAMFLGSIPKASSVSAQLVEGERMEHYRKQLYRFCEIRHNI